MRYNARMNAPRERNYVVGAKAVNRRTRPRPPAPVAAASAVVQERAAAARARQRVGTPLAELLRAPGNARQPVSGAAIAGGVLAAGGTVALFLGALQGSVLLGGCGALAALAGSGAAWRFRRAPGGPVPELPAMPLLDEAAIRAFDDAVLRVTPELPGEAAQALVALKHLIVRIARAPGATGADEHFTFEDRMYVGECVRRYLPDALQAYLAVPKAQRAAPVADGQTPQALLLGQLEMLGEALRERERKLARRAAEALLQQERFLKAKR